MQRFLSRCILTVLAMSSVAATCGGPDSIGGADSIVVIGSAPLHKGGHVIAVLAEDEQNEQGQADIDDAGAFELAVTSSRPVVLKASGGTYIEPAYGLKVPHGGETLRAALVGDDSRKVHVSITPWTELAVSATITENLAGYNKYLVALTATLTCNDVPYRHLLAATPASPSKGSPVQTLDTPNLAYLYLGAWSQLTADLAQEAGMPPGARLTSMGLARALSDDASDGIIDGKKGNADIFVIDRPLDPGILRQPLAQAMRRFLKNERSNNSLPESSVLPILGCVSQDATPALGVQGQTLDIDGPTIRFRSPEADVYISTPQQLACEAHDSSGVATLHASIWRGDEQIAVEQPTMESRATARSWQGRLRIDSLESGTLTFQCEATDRWGNPSVDSRNVHVNRGTHFPKLGIGEGRDANKLTGIVTVTCDCSSDTYNHRCALDANGIDPAHITPGPSQGGRSTYTWDTTAGLDGEAHLTCQNWAHGLGAPTTTWQQVYVKNVPDGSAEGRVYFDTLVHDAMVTAYAYRNGQPGRVLGTADAQNGNFTMALSTEYEGPVLFEAKASSKSHLGARYKNVPLDTSVEIGNARLTLLLDHYAPGEPVTGLSINIASSLAESLAVGVWRTAEVPGSFVDAVNDTHVLFAQYLLPSNPLDFRRTRVGNLSAAVDISVPDAETILGLFHVGFSRLAVEYSIAACGRARRTCIKATDILAGLREDIKDGVFDGKSPNHPRILLGHNVELHADFLRIELAHGIRRWLDQAAFVNDPLEPKNVTGLSSAAYKRHFLQGLAANTSPLFGREAVPYDQDGPVLTVTIYNGNEVVELDGKTVGNANFRVVVDAVDEDTGVAKVTAAGPNGALPNLAKSSARGEFVFSTDDIPDGPHQLVLDAQDGHGNTNPKIISFRVDKVPPVVTLDSRDVWVADGNAFRVRGLVSKSRMHAEIFVDGVSAASWVLDDNAMAFDSPPIPIVCDAEHEVTVQVRDAAHNYSDAKQRVHCDSRAPTITPLPSPFTNEKSQTKIDLATLVEVVGSKSAPTGLNNLHVLEKLWTTLDKSSTNLPTLRFVINDIGERGIGTPMTRLRVAYKYVFADGGASREGEWTPLQCGEEGCALPFSYQGMLPRAVLEQPLSSQRRGNFIARSQKSDKHTVMIRVQDEAGNFVTANWSFRLGLFAPAIQVTCDFHDEVKNAELRPNPSVQSVMRANAGIFSVQVRTQSTEGSDSDTLTPDDGEHRVNFAPAELEWRVETVLQQVYRLRRYYAPPPLSFSTCANGEWRNSNIFEDGTCTSDAIGHRGTEKQWSWNSTADHPELTARQTAVPVYPTAALTNLNPVLDNKFNSVNAPTSTTGLPLSFETAATAQGQMYAQLSFRKGYQYLEVRDMAWEIDERRFVKKLRAVRREPYLPTVNPGPGTPESIAIIYSKMCLMPAVAFWQEGLKYQAWDGP